MLNGSRDEAAEVTSQEREFKERMKSMNYMNTVRLFRTANELELSTIRKQEEFNKTTTVTKKP